MGFCWDDFRSLGVPQHQVCVGAHSHTPLPGVAVEDLGSIGAGHCYKIILIHLPRDLGRAWGNGNRWTQPRACCRHSPSPQLCYCWTDSCAHVGEGLHCHRAVVIGEGTSEGKPCLCGIKDMGDRIYFPYFPSTPKAEFSEKQDLHCLAPTPAQASQDHWRGLRTAQWRKTGSEPNQCYLSSSLVILRKVLFLFEQSSPKRGFRVAPKLLQSAQGHLLCGMQDRAPRDAAGREVCTEVQGHRLIPPSDHSPAARQILRWHTDLSPLVEPGLTRQLEPWPLPHPTERRPLPIHLPRSLGSMMGQNTSSPLGESDCELEWRMVPIQQPLKTPWRHLCVSVSR